jgi:hypothetical protein
MKIPDRDLDLLRNLVFDPNAKPMFDFLKSCLFWFDERPSERLSAEGSELLTDLLIVRGFFHRSVPIEEWGLDPEYFKAVWEFGLANIPQWIGFKRLVLSESEQAFLAECLANNNL